MLYEGQLIESFRPAANPTIDGGGGARSGGSLLAKILAASTFRELLAHGGSTLPGSEQPSAVRAVAPPSGDDRTVATSAGGARRIDGFSAGWGLDSDADLSHGVAPDLECTITEDSSTSAKAHYAAGISTMGVELPCGDRSEPGSPGSTTSDRARLDQSIRLGDPVWHRMPVAARATEVLEVYSSVDRITASCLFETAASATCFDGAAVVRAAESLVALELEPAIESAEFPLISAAQAGLCAALTGPTMGWNQAELGPSRCSAVLLAAAVHTAVLGAAGLGVQVQAELLDALCASCPAAGSPARALAVSWLAKLAPGRLRSVVELLQQLLTTRVGRFGSVGMGASEGFPPGALRVAVGLQLLHDANEAGKATAIPGRDRLGLGVFYNETISSRLRYKSEYFNWKKRLERPSTGVPSPLEYGFLLAPACKARILRIDAVSQMSQTVKDAFVHQAWVHQAQKMRAEQPDDPTDPVYQDVVRAAINPYLLLQVRRGQLIEDTMSQISSKLKDLKKPLKVQYVGGGEEGLDLGGVQKEFFQLIIEAAFNPAHAMFVEIESTRHTWFNVASLEAKREFELVGILVGLAIYNGVILDLHFPRVVYKKLLGEPVGLTDLKIAFPALGSGLQQLLDFEGDVAAVFCQTFTASEQRFDHVEDVELIEGGANVEVTAENRAEFVERFVQYKLVDSVAPQFRAFHRGFHLVCGGEALTLLRPEELETLACGSTELNLNELERSAAYAGGYHRDSPPIQWLWAILHGYSTDKLRLFLKFVTGSDRVPIKGLGELGIVVQRNDGSDLRLPTALTCFSRLLLPEYPSKKVRPHAWLSVHGIQPSEMLGAVPR